MQGYMDTRRKSEIRSSKSETRIGIWVCCAKSFFCHRGHRGRRGVIIFDGIYRINRMKVYRNISI